MFHLTTFAVKKSLENIERRKLHIENDNKTDNTIFSCALINYYSSRIEVVKLIADIQREEVVYIIREILPVQCSSTRKT